MRPELKMGVERNSDSELGNFEMATCLLDGKTCEKVTTLGCAELGRHIHDRAPRMKRSPHSVWGREGCERTHLSDTGAGANRYGARIRRLRWQESELLSPMERLLYVKRAE
jgi:hypothetical protein